MYYKIRKCDMITKETIIHQEKGKNSSTSVNYERKPFKQLFMKCETANKKKHGLIYSNNIKAKNMQATT